MTDAAAGPLNIAVLGAAARHERVGLLVVASPAILLIGAICLLPVAWLFWISFTGENGFTLEHYRRIVENPVYLQIFWNTFLVSAIITFLAILLGFPLCYAITLLPDRLSVICIGLVLLPFWTSLLVRTYAWLVLLQRNGIINDLLQFVGIIDTPLRLAYTWPGTVVGMLHIVLPFFILPMYAAMRSMDHDLMRAASSLGASPTRAFWTVFVPMTLPGITAGALLVFVYCLGFYVTPEILGGGRIVIIAMKVQQNATIYADWGAASSVGLILLAVTLAVFLVIARIVRRQRATVHNV